MRVVLASKSPRRKEILDNIGIKFDVLESNFDETIISPMEPEEVVKYLSYKKAEDVLNQVKDEAIVIGADTIVYLDSMILGKPKSEEEAFQMLKRLSGRWHNVYSGICVIDSISGEYYQDFENTAVKIKTLTDDDIINYIDTKEPLDKAGSYGIQGIGSLIVEKINGCYFNVVGLPVFKLSSLLGKFGIDAMGLRG